MFKESNDKELVQLEPKSQNLLIGLGKHGSMEGDWHLNCYIIQPVVVSAVPMAPKVSLAKPSNSKPCLWKNMLIHHE